VSLPAFERAILVQFSVQSRQFPRQLLQGLSQPTNYASDDWRKCSPQLAVLSLDFHLLLHSQVSSLDFGIIGRLAVSIRPASPVAMLLLQVQYSTPGANLKTPMNNVKVNGHVWINV